MNKVLVEYFQLLVEKKMKEAHLSGGKTADWGSDEHVSDLESRWYDICTWRDKYPRGSEARANYSRLANRLKTELNSAKKAAEKRRLNEKERLEPEGD